MSSEDIVLSVKNISKCYEMYQKPAHRLFQFLFGKRKKFYQEFWALKDISFEIKKGECWGIIGKNGAGKSTLLQILTGTTHPTSGTIETKGRIAALLELGSGFNPEFTGRENIYMNGALLGLTKEELDSRYNDIIAFADIGDFVERPVKTYSSGMMIRLAFSVIAHVETDILIIDEALSVGDAFFVQKCMRFLRKFMETNTVIFVSHDTGAVVNLCDHAIMLEKGKIQKMGSPKEVSEAYLAAIYEGSHGKSKIQKKITPDFKNENTLEEYRDMRDQFINFSNLRNDIEIFKFKENFTSFGKGNAIIKNVELLDADRRRLSWVVGGEKVCLKVTCQIEKEIFNPIIGFHVKDRLGQNLFGDNTYLSYYQNPNWVKENTVLVGEFDFIMPRLPIGDYSFAVAVAEGTQKDHIQHHWINDALFFKSHSSSVCSGLVGIPLIEIRMDYKLKNEDNINKSENFFC